MADNKDIRDGRDCSKIDINDPAEVKYLHQQYPHLSYEEVLDQVRRWGPSREAVKEKLDGMKKDQG
jgi:hypothetical protein